MSHIIGKSLYIHIPKTGGTFLKLSAFSFIRSVCNVNCGYNTKYNLAHANKELFDLVYGDNNLIPFCFVRHPAKFLYSRWKHMRSERYSKDPEFVKKMCYGNNQEYYNKLEKPFVDFVDYESFENTVNNFVKRSGIIEEHFHNYTKGCAYVGKTEKLVENLIDIFNRVDYNILYNVSLNTLKNLPKLNVSEEENEMTRELFDEICKSEKDFIKIYDY